MLFVTVYFGIFSIFVCVLYVLHCAPIVRNNDNMSQARRYRGGAQGGFSPPVGERLPPPVGEF